MPSLIQDFPGAVFSQEEAMALLAQAHQLRLKYEDQRRQSHVRLQRALDDAKIADKLLFDADIHIGRIKHIIHKSGFQVLKRPVPRRKRQVLTEGGMFY